MKTYQSCFIGGEWQSNMNDNECAANEVNLVLGFGAAELVSQSTLYDNIREKYPQAQIVLASTAGEIAGEEVRDNTVTFTAIAFEKTRINAVQTIIADHENSFAVGCYLIQHLHKAGTDLKGVLVISDGLQINGSELASGLNAFNANHVMISGGLAGDGAKFVSTYTGLNCAALPGNVIAIGFYGEHIQIGHGSFGGWDEFGKERIITKSDKNVLYEIDGKNALDLYKEYLGPYANELPGSALLFPLSIQIQGYDKKLVRTILTINEVEKSMTFAGNLPEGSSIRLMKANFDKLIDAATVAAENSVRNKSAQLAILISCVGRKLILQERTFEEVKAAKEILGDNTTVCGFYAYGEISPFNTGVNCELHNQTMTISTFTEI